jgi:LacI family transcriptional regulator
MDNGSPQIPVYHKIKEALYADISESYDIGSMIPPEFELAKKFGVHRGTMRKAIDFLVRDGILSRERGRGTFVIKKPSVNGASNAVKSNSIIQIAICFASNKKDIQNNEFYFEVLQGIIDEAGDRTNTMIFHLDDEMSTFNSIKNRIISVHAAGIVIIGNCSDQTISRFKNLSIPLVLGDCYTLDDSVDCVVSDNVKASFEAVSHMIRSGHRNIGIIAGPRNDKSAVERYQGYSMALNMNGIKIDTKNVSYSKDMGCAGGYESMMELIRNKTKASAIFAVNDTLAIGAMNAARESKLRVPEDIGFIGFDDIARASQSSPALTTMRVNRFNMGVTIAQRLFSKLKHERLVAEKIILQPKLVERESFIPKK